MINHGTLVISLDYELMWGMIDTAEKNGYGETNVRNVPVAIDRMLELFSKYDVHATFATVGMIMFDNKEELQRTLPSVRPSYKNSLLSPYENNYINNITEDEKSLFFQNDVIERLKLSPQVEVGTHTFCHYYCCAEGQTVEQFEADIIKAKEVAESKGISLKSIVFPRNQVSPEHLKVCAKHGITSYRGCTTRFFGDNKTRISDLKDRICRLLDAYINIGGNTSVPYSDIDLTEQPINLRASRMVRPYSRKLAAFENIRMHRIKNEMRYAARNNQMYHLWWHPHNFGADMDENFKNLETILQCYKECHIKYGMKSLTMTELTEELTRI